MRTLPRSDRCVCRRLGRHRAPAFWRLRRGRRSAGDAGITDAAVRSAEIPVEPVVPKGRRFGCGDAEDTGSERGRCRGRRSSQGRSGKDRCGGAETRIKIPRAPAPALAESGEPREGCRRRVECRRRSVGTVVRPSSRHRGGGRAAERSGAVRSGSPVRRAVCAAESVRRRLAGSHRCGREPVGRMCRRMRRRPPVRAGPRLFTAMRMRRTVAGNDLEYAIFRNLI